MTAEEEFRKTCEEHWEYTQGIVSRVLNIGAHHLTDNEKVEIVGLCRYLYVAAMVHGWKHAYEEMT